jgi:hypothetical protein
MLKGIDRCIGLSAKQAKGVKVAVEALMELLKQERRATARNGLHPQALPSIQSYMLPN